MKECDEMKECEQGVAAITRLLRRPLLRLRQRTYPTLAGLVLAGACLPLLQPRLAEAAALFQSTDVDATRFAVLARPVGENDWTLLVLEQLAASPACWQGRADGLVDPALNRFDYTGICNRYLDSNGYSLRVADEDLGTSYRLRVQQVGNRLELQATSPQSSSIVVVGRAEVPRRDRDGFVAIQLEPGWELRRRSYAERALSHLYFATQAPLDQLIARGPRADFAERRGPAFVNPPPVGMAATGPAAGSGGSDAMTAESGGRVIALQVIPYSGGGSEGP
jgi:hypothetical protein